jgi:hypothetical protein
VRPFSHTGINGKITDWVFTRSVTASQAISARKTAAATYHRHKTAVSSKEQQAAPIPATSPFVKMEWLYAGRILSEAFNCTDTLVSRVVSIAADAELLVTR